MRPQALLSSLLFAVLVGACVGTVSEPGAEARGPDEVPPPPPAECTGETFPSVAPLGRLTRGEYERALRDLFGDEAVDASQGGIDAIPVEAATVEGTFSRQDQRLSDRHVEGYYRIADELAARVAADPALRMRAGDACGGAIDDACVRSFAETFLSRAYRRRPLAVEVDRVVAAAAEFAGDEQVHAVIFLGLMSPDFVYRFENRGTPERGVMRLTAHEVASRLSFHFWGAPPDAELLAAADSGALDDPARYAEQVERLMGDPRTDALLLGFFEEWLHLDRGGFADSPRLEALRAGIEIDGLAAEMRAEVDDLIHFYLSGDDGTWDDVLTSNLSFARSARLADIYGAEVWDGSGAPPTLPAGERSGLLTRAGMLMSTDGSTNPFRRGAFVRRMVLCDHVAPPPADLPPDALTPPPVEAGASTRESFEAKVNDEPCATCHAQFAPFGYGFEDYDGLGRFRTDEHLVTTEGEDRGLAAVDASVVPGVDPGDTRPTQSGVELSARIAESEKASACLSRQYFRFSYRHTEDARDRCTIEAWTQAIEAGQGLRETLRSVALDPTFRQRVLED